MGARPQDFHDHLLALYSAACAPLSADTVINDLPSLETNDFTARLAIDEYRYMARLSAAGFDAFSNAFDRMDHDALDLTEYNGDSGHKPELTTMLIAGSAFAKRLSRLADNLNVLCTAAAEKSLCDPATIVRDLERRVKQGERPSDPELAACLNLTRNSSWDTLEVPLKNRVGFKETTAVISEGKIQEGALKVTEFRRRKQRNPTGYHKFHFKDLGVDDSDFESEGRRSGRAPSTDGGSTRGSLCGNQAHGALTSRSASSGGEEHDLEEDFDKPNLFELADRNSSVVFSFDKEREVIDDKEADPEWEEKQRHQRRFSRIRNRVPTGHPSLMRGASDELAEIVDQFEKQLSSVALDAIAAENTEANRSIASKASLQHGGLFNG